MKKFFKFIGAINIIKTLVINFSLLPIKQAIRFPILIYGRYRIYNISGSIEFQCPIKFGLLRLNYPYGNYYSGPGQGCLSLYGEIRIGGFCLIGCGGILYIRKGAVLELGDNVRVSGMSRIIAHEKIGIGNDVQISWDFQIYDTNFHYILYNNRVTRLTKPIKVGNNVWIGNNVTIAKGSIIPDYTIVASHSLINKSFSTSSCEGGILLAGCPAIVKKEGVIPIINFVQEEKYNSYFDVNIDCVFVDR